MSPVRETSVPMRASMPGRTLVEWPAHPPVFPRPGATASELAALLEAMQAGDVDDVALLEQVVGWQQLVGVALAAQARAVRDLVARGYDATGVLADEIASALASTRTAAQVLVSRAAGLGELPAVETALRDGAMDSRKVDAVLDELAALVVGTDALPDVAAVDAAANAVAQVAAERAGDLTPTQLRRVVRREVIAVDPAAARERSRRAVEQRRVETGWAPDGMAWVSAFVPAPDAMLVKAVLDAATEPVAAHDHRPRDQRRADVLVSIFRTIADQGTLPCGTSVPGRRGARPQVQVTVAASTLLGLDENPAELAGYGPLPADVARQVAQDATWRRLLTDPLDGTLVERSTRAYRPGRVLGGHVSARDQTCTFPGCVRPAASCELDHVEPWREAPAAAAASGDPPQTRADNLQPLCKGHHDLKTKGLWKARRSVPDGGVEWTSHLGVRYLVRPQPVLSAPTSPQAGRSRVARVRDDAAP